MFRLICDFVYNLSIKALSYNVKYDIIMLAITKSYGDVYHGF